MKIPCIESVLLLVTGIRLRIAQCGQGRMAGNGEWRAMVNGGQW